MNFSIFDFSKVPEIMEAFDKYPTVRRFCYCVLGVAVLYIVAPIILELVKHGA